MQRIVALLSVLLMAAPAFAYGRPLVPEGEWNDETRLTLARAMVGEADWHEPDHIAIAFVLAKRWRVHRLNREPISFQRYIQLYAASLRGESERTQWIRSLTLGPLPGPYEQRWNRIQKLVTAFSRGVVRDPCPAAMHWGGTMDRPNRGLLPVSCGMTRNIFYAKRDRLARMQASSPAQSLK